MIFGTKYIENINAITSKTASDIVIKELIKLSTQLDWVSVLVLLADMREPNNLV